MKKTNLQTSSTLVISLAALTLTGCATSRPPRQVGPPPEPVMPPSMRSSADPTLPAPQVVDFNVQPVTLPAPQPVVQPAPVAPRKGTSYTIRKGESLSAIAARNKMSWRELADYNYITDPNKVRAGQVILIPGSGSAPAPAPAAPTTSNRPTAPSTAVSSGKTYVVQAGDSLSVVASRYGTSVRELKSVNGLNSDRLLVGQILKLPGGTSARPANNNQPTVRPAPAPTATPAPIRAQPTPIPIEEPLELDPAPANPVEQPDVPDEDPLTAKTFPVVVEEGDTLESIANNYIVPVEEIRKYNNLPKDAVLTPGQKLQIPPSVY